MVFNKSRMASASAEGFYAHCAAAGKKIKKASALNRTLNNIENSFPEHGGCRAGLITAGRLKLEAAESTAENAQAHPIEAFVLLQGGQACLLEDIVHRINALAGLTIPWKGADCRVLPLQTKYLF